MGDPGSTLERGILRLAVRGRSELEQGIVWLGLGERRDVEPICRVLRGGRQLVDRLVDALDGSAFVPVSIDECDLVIDLVKVGRERRLERGIFDFVQVITFDVGSGSLRAPLGRLHCFEPLRPIFGLRLIRGPAVPGRLR